MKLRKGTKKQAFDVGDLVALETSNIVGMVVELVDEEPFETLAFAIAWTKPFGIRKSDAIYDAEFLRLIQKNES